MKCKTCFSKLYCEEQTKLECKNNNYFLYHPEAWTKLTEFIEEFNKHAHMRHPEIDSDFFDGCELKMAKAFLDGYPEIAVRVSKIILALKDVGDIKIKIE